MRDALAPGRRALVGEQLGRGVEQAQHRPHALARDAQPPKHLEQECAGRREACKGLG